MSDYEVNIEMTPELQKIWDGLRRKYGSDQRIAQEFLRKVAAEEDPPPALPKPDIPPHVLVYDWTPVGKAVVEYAEWLASDDYHEDRIGDYEQNIYERAVEAVYGPDVWDKFVNKVII